MSFLKALPNGNRGLWGDNRRSGYVWDALTRLLHWLLVVSIVVCWWTGMHNELEYHLYSGYAVLWIILMRFYWGFVGTSTARFVNFVRGPKAVAAYARELHKRNLPNLHGHNPLGALSVVLMLGMVFTVAALGLFAVDVDGLYSGPLSGYVSFHTGRFISHLHYKAFNALLVVIAVHVLAIVFYYFYKRQNLIFPMITGKHRGEGAVDAELRVAPAWRIALGAGIVSVIVWLIKTGFYF